MDGKGCIQINQKGKKSLQYRLIISLINTKLNYNMLLYITKIIKGKVFIIKNNKEVIWLMDNKKEIENLINIFIKYPPLTSRLNCQLEFLKFCLTTKCAFNFLKKRNKKYNKQSNIIKNFNNNFNLPYYFPY